MLFPFLYGAESLLIAYMGYKSTDPVCKGMAKGGACIMFIIAITDAVLNCLR